MATGRVATAQITGANTNQTIYTVPTGFYGVYNLSFTNTSAASVTLKFAVGATTTPAASEYYEFDTVVPGKGVFERTGLVCGAGLNLIAQASAANVVNVNVYGIETSTS